MEDSNSVAVRSDVISAQPALLLQSVLPSHRPRYSLQPPREPAVTSASIQASTRPQSYSEDKGDMPPGWNEFITPEGDTYYYYPAKRIVTTVDPRDDTAGEILLDAYQALLKEASTIRNAEVYLHIRRAAGAQATKQVVQYYAIDHTTPQPFWLHDIPIEGLELEGIDAVGFLQSTLLPEYWTHMDYFPNHCPVGMTHEDKLIAMLHLGCIDDMTALGSTCPYSAEECRRHLDVLGNLVSLGVTSAYRTSSFARIWGSIARARHINHYGLNAPRLDRFQGMHEFMESKSNHSFAHGVGELSRSTFVYLTSLWNGRVVYRRHWHAFFTDTKDFCLRILASILLLLYRKDSYSRLSMALEITELTLGHVHDPIVIVPDPQDPGENSWQLLHRLIVNWAAR